MTIVGFLLIVVPVVPTLFFVTSSSVWSADQPQGLFSDKTVTHAVSDHMIKTKNKRNIFFFSLSVLHLVF